MEFLNEYVSPEALAFLQNQNVQMAIGFSFLVMVLGCCRIFARTGRHGALGLLMLVPGLNLLMFLFLAFGRWPAQTELRLLRRAQKASMRVERKVQDLAA